jgi:hypothetical protein
MFNTKLVELSELLQKYAAPKESEEGQVQPAQGESGTRRRTSRGDCKNAIGGQLEGCLLGKVDHQVIRHCRPRPAYSASYHKAQLERILKKPKPIHRRIFLPPQMGTPTLKNKSTL